MGLSRGRSARSFPGRPGAVRSGAAAAVARAGRPVPPGGASEGRYVLYARMDTRECVALAGVLRTKGLEVARVEPDASLGLSLAVRAGSDHGPFLRTPEGFLLAGLDRVLGWLERAHPEPALLPPPDQPLRRLTARILEDWLDRWLPRVRSPLERSLETLDAHLARSEFLLGAEPSRPDWLLAAWLEADCFARAPDRARAAQRLPRLVALGPSLLASSPGRSADDALPISLLPVLREIALGRHAYLRANHAALRAGHARVGGTADVVGEPVSRTCEARRHEMARELRSLDGEARRDVGCVLDPLGLGAALRLPPALRPLDPADPRLLGAAER